MEANVRNTVISPQNLKKSSKCVCIIPFYNEKKTIIPLLSTLIKNKRISTIICVDDGSEDDASSLIRKKFPQVVLVVCRKNRGKSFAIKEGLKVVPSSTQFVLLLDGDHQKLDNREIESGISYVFSDPNLDMLIFKHINDPLVSKLIRTDVLFSGDRILKVNDLKQVYKSNPKGFQLEIAINLYMMKNKKKACWVTSSVETPFKFKKRGIKEGLTMDFQMVVSILTYTNYKNHLESVLRFCADEYQPVVGFSTIDKSVSSSSYKESILRTLSKEKTLLKLYRSLQGKSE